MLARPRSAPARCIWLPLREPDREQARVEPGEHVGLILRGIGAAREEQAAAVLGEAGVVAGDELLGADPAARRRGGRRSGSCRCSGCTGSASRRARSRARTATTTAAEALAEIERHVREPERGGRSPARRAPTRASSSALGARARGIRPEPQSHADRSWPASRAREQRHRAVDPAAHGDGDPLVGRRRAEPGPGRRGARRPRVAAPGIAAASSIVRPRTARAELGDAGAFASRRGDAAAVDLEANPGDVVVRAAELPDQLFHGHKSVLHPADEAPDVRNLGNQVGALPAGAPRRRSDPSSLSVRVGSTLRPEPRTGSSTHPDSCRLSPAKRQRIVGLVGARPARAARAWVSSKARRPPRPAPRSTTSVLTSLSPRQTTSVDAARKHWVGDADRAPRERAPPQRSGARRRPQARPDDRGVSHRSGRARRRRRRPSRLVASERAAPRVRRGAHRGQARLALEQRRAHAPGRRSSRPPNDSRTRPSNSAGSDPSACANWRRCRKRYDHSSRRSGCARASSRAMRSRSQRFHSRGRLSAGGSRRPGRRPAAGRDRLGRRRGRRLRRRHRPEATAALDGLGRRGLPPASAGLVVRARVRRLRLGFRRRGGSSGSGSGSGSGMAEAQAGAAELGSGAARAPRPTAEAARAAARPPAPRRVEEAAAREAVTVSLHDAPRVAAAPGEPFDRPGDQEARRAMTAATTHQAARRAARGRRRRAG